MTTKQTNNNRYNYAQHYMIMKNMRPDNELAILFDETVDDIQKYRESRLDGWQDDLNLESELPKLVRKAIKKYMETEIDEFFDIDTLSTEIYSILGYYHAVKNTTSQDIQQNSNDIVRVKSHVSSEIKNRKRHDKPVPGACHTIRRDKNGDILEEYYETYTIK